mmetsp:Transcript_6111/g.21660  ORF Transcript_6111/g.21660 Transcript_6111/m.21660 type:complete len:395 (-) Transcript_6111:344-1528(-)
MFFLKRIALQERTNKIDQSFSDPSQCLCGEKENCTSSVDEILDAAKRLDQLSLKCNEADEASEANSTSCGDSLNEEAQHGKEDSCKGEESADSIEDSSLCRELDDSPPTSVGEAKSRVEDALRELMEEGIPFVHHESIKWGKQLGKGAFGTVKLASCVLFGQIENAAIKTITASDREFNERLKSFKAEALISWRACAKKRTNSQLRSRVCNIYAISYHVVHEDVGPSAHLHLLIEHIPGSIDLHKEISGSKSWSNLRCDGKDTGRRLRSRYVTIDEDGDVFAYVMPRARKLHFAVELSWGLAELRRADIVHCDVKPSNALLQEKRRGKSPGVILIDFGEANFSEQAKDWNAGTPGYQAPEVEEEGASFASDVYSLGVSLIELWTGDVWQGAETR